MTKGYAHKNITMTNKELKAEARRRGKTTMSLKDVHLDKMTKEEFIRRYARPDVVYTYADGTIIEHHQQLESDLDELLRETAEDRCENCMHSFHDKKSNLCHDIEEFYKE